MRKLPDFVIRQPAVRGAWEKWEAEHQESDGGSGGQMSALSDSRMCENHRKEGVGNGTGLDARGRWGDCARSGRGTWKEEPRTVDDTHGGDDNPKWSKRELSRGFVLSVFVEYLLCSECLGASKSQLLSPRSLCEKKSMTTKKKG